MSRRAIFRCDASSAIGGGHVMRCLTLADALAARGWTCRFACTAKTTETVPALAARGYAMIALDDEGGFVDAADLLIVDHYNWSRAQETACRGQAESILVIDDLADRPHDCDWLLDQTFGREATDYRSLVGRGCRLLVGTSYALLRPQFAARRRAALAARRASEDIRRFLVSFGASDPHGVTETALRGIAAAKLDVSVDVVLGANDPNRGKLQSLADAMTQNVTFHANVDDMAALMADADVAIGAAGTSAWERCCLGLPALLVITAENQKMNASALVAAGAAYAVGDERGFDPLELTERLCGLRQDPGRLRCMSEAASAVCDGRGVDRVIEVLATS